MLIRAILPRIEYAWQSLQLKANEPSADMRSFEGRDL